MTEDRLVSLVNEAYSSGEDLREDFFPHLSWGELLLLLYNSGEIPEDNIREIFKEEDYI